MRSIRSLAAAGYVVLIAVSGSGAVAQGSALPADAQAKTASELAYFQKEGSRSGLTNLKIDTKFEFPRVIVTGFRANLGSGTVSGTGRVDLFNPLGRQTMKVQYRGVPLSAYVRSYLVKWDADISGTIDADLDLTWNGITRNQAKRTMSGTGTVRYSGGTISRASAVREAGTRARITRPLPQTIRRGIATGTMSSGQLTINQLRIIGQNVAAEGRGRVNLSTGVADTEFDLYASEAIAGNSPRRRGGQAASWAGAAGRVPLAVGLKITGDLESPSLQVTTSR